MTALEEFLVFVGVVAWVYIVVTLATLVLRRRVNGEPRRD